MFIGNHWRDVTLAEVQNPMVGPRSDREVAVFLLGKLNRAGREVMKGRRKISRIEARNRILVRLNDVRISRLLHQRERLLSLLKAKRLPKFHPAGSPRTMVDDALRGGLVGVMMGELRRDSGAVLSALEAKHGKGMVLGDRRKVKGKPKPASTGLIGRRRRRG